MTQVAEAALTPKEATASKPVVEEAPVPKKLAAPEAVAAAAGIQAAREGAVRGGDPDRALRALVEGGENGEKTGPKKWKENEKAYLEETKGKCGEGLAERYSDTRTSADVVLGQTKGYVEGVIGKASAGLTEDKVKAMQHDNLAELADKGLTEETRAVIEQKALERVALLFNSEHASRNPEKQRIVAEQTRQYIDLVAQAQQEGSLPQELSAQAVLDLVDENIGKLAYQDRAATENWLGDHGVRHLVDHNINVSMQLADKLAAKGQVVSAADRLMLHQIMIDHDMGYAMDVVRDPINQGRFGADGGHNVLAAKFVREQAEAGESAFSKVFSGDQAAIIHEAILHHDSRDVNLAIGDTSEEARKRNIESIVHIADNTHAFEDKLPEVLYSHPDTLRVMRLLKTAGELDDDEAIGGLREELIAGIDKRDDLSDDDKTALKKAAGIISKHSYKKSVPRICGNRPQFEVEDDDGRGIVTISVEESSIHRETTGIFAPDQVDKLQSFMQAEQVTKFIGDTTGVKNVDSDTVASPEGSVIVKVLSNNESPEATDYQKRLDELIKDQEFSDFIIADASLAARLNYAKALFDLGEIDQVTLGAQVTALIESRKQGLRSYMEKKKGSGSPIAESTTE